MSPPIGSVHARSGLDLSIRNMTILSKPQIEIVLDAAQGVGDAYITSFSTLDEIKGIVKISARHDTPFEKLEIAMLGITKTYVDKVASPTAMRGRQESIHRFLKLTQPIGRHDLPRSRLLEADKVYEVPFHFAVPERLLPKACQHKYHHDAVREAHLQVPPSFGDPAISGFGSTLLDDFAPLMTRIVYSIQVEMYRNLPNGGPQAILAEASKKLRIKPAFEEQPPIDLDIYGKHEDYSLRQEKTMRKGMLKGKLGRLVMETSQPSAIKLPAIALGMSYQPVNTKIEIALRFDPTDEATQPPRLGSLNSKIKVATFFASTPRINFPSRTAIAYDGTLGYISEFVNLSSMCVANVEWRKHDSSESPMSRRASVASDALITLVVRSNSASETAILEPSSDYKGKCFYTATILVPLTLPMNKNFVPSFHSCLVSRVYGLHVSLGISGQAFGSTVTLKLPVQITSEGSLGSLERRRQSNFMLQTHMDADAAFEPRNVGPPPDIFLNQSQLTPRASVPSEPPSYSFFESSPALRGASLSVAG